jgi:hypothetical protein
MFIYIEKSRHVILSTIDFRRCDCELIHFHAGFLNLFYLRLFLFHIPSLVNFYVVWKVTGNDIKMEKTIQRKPKNHFISHSFFILASGPSEIHVNRIIFK